MAKTRTGAGVAYSAKGNLLAIGKLDGSVEVLDGSTYEKLAVLREYDKPVVFLAFSPDGKVLATASLDRITKTTTLWDVSGLTKRKPQ